jgi:hypothetical protein
MSIQAVDVEPIEEVCILYFQNGTRVLEINPPVMVGKNGLPSVSIEFVNDIAGLFGENTKYRIRNDREKGRYVTQSEFREELRK